MAGIGLRLQTLARKGTYLDGGISFLSAAIIAVGPWLSAVLALALLNRMSAGFLDDEAHLLLFATITYTFCISLVVTSGPQLVITRFLADRLYLRDIGAISPTCAGILCTGAVCFLIALPLCLLLPFGWQYRLLVALLVGTCSLIWLVVPFLSAAREYMGIVLSFVTGYGMSLGAAVILGRAYGLGGGLTGFLLGQWFCLLLLVLHIYREFPPSPGLGFAFLRYFRTYRDLFLVGLLYAAGIWIDNVIYWYSPAGVTVAGSYRALPEYDFAKLLAYISTVPAAAVFLSHVESDFYGYYRAFFHNVVERGSLNRIVAAKQGMVSAVRGGVLAILRIQGLVVAVTIIAAPQIAGLVGLPLDRAGLLRVAVLAAAGQFVVQASVLFLLYLDDRRSALAVVATFVAVNATLTLATVGLGERFQGIGYLLAGVIAGAVALWRLKHRLTWLEYLTFMSQPMKPSKR